jgi:hypothetical protein
MTFGNKHTMNDHAAETILLEAEERLDARDLGVALDKFCAAEARGADADRCSAGRWMTSMLRGDFASAWRESDAIRRRGTLDPHRFWNGEEIRGKRLMVRCLHGFGDAVQFLRHAPALQALAPNVVFEVPPRFIELARYFDGVTDVITWGDGAPNQPPQWDVQIEVMELPYLFRTELRDLPIATRYLHLPQHLVANVTKQMDRCRRPRIGVVWSAGEWNPSRSVPFATLAPLLQTADCEFWNLQPADAAPDQMDVRLRQAEGCRDSILVLAAVISRLDLVLTVDTLAAHLAGALGIPAWVMLQHAADWRWMTATSRSPWYPSLRLFRQPRPDDWASVVADIQRSLPAWSYDSNEGLIAS